MIRQGRNHVIDFLKGLAIIAVILYHLGVSTFGYLGVDVFFVISGYYVAIGLVKEFNKERFSYWEYLNKRLARLWPGLILISIISLVLGYFFMMPMHYKLNCESVIGTCFFGNNIVQYITSGDYWTSSNQYKPLMHTWYVGILMQFYLVIPIIFIIARKFTKEWLRWCFYILILLSIISIGIYVSPVFTVPQNFYLLPSRFFELAIGGLLAIAMMDNSVCYLKTRPILLGSLILLSIVLIFGMDIDSMKLRLISVVCISVLMVWCSNYFTLNPTLQNILSPITYMGVASYSLYLSHQVLFAFYRYIVNNIFSVTTYLWILAITLIVGIMVYLVFEQPLSKLLGKGKRNIYITNGISLIIAIILSGFAYMHFRQGGLVRDIPELDQYVGMNRMTPEQYNSIGFTYDKDFEDNGKKNIYVIGDSFGRDWINILRESGIDSTMNISYTMYANGNTANRIKKADIIFVATCLSIFSSYNYDQILPELLSDKVWRVGIKSFGEKFIGNYYNKDSKSHSNPDNFISSNILETNEYEKRLFGEHYIDMMEPITDKNKNIILFTPDGKLITSDGIHLTEEGAKYYKERLNVQHYLQ